MASGDSLKDLLDAARREMPDVPPEVWERFACLASLRFGASRIYIASQKKRRHLDAMADVDADQEAEQVAAKLGVSVRHARRLRKLNQ